MGEWWHKLGELIAPNWRAGGKPSVGGKGRPHQLRRVQMRHALALRDPNHGATRKSLHRNPLGAVTASDRLDLGVHSWRGRKQRRRRVAEACQIADLAVPSPP